MMDMYDKNTTVGKLETQLARHLIDPYNATTAKAALEAKRARAQRDLLECDFLEEAVALFQKYKGIFPDLVR